MGCLLPLSYADFIAEQIVIEIAKREHSSEEQQPEMTPTAAPAPLETPQSKDEQPDSGERKEGEKRRRPPRRRKPAGSKTADAPTESSTEPPAETVPVQPAADNQPAPAATEEKKETQRRRRPPRRRSSVKPPAEGGKAEEQKPEAPTQGGTPPPVQEPQAAEQPKPKRSFLETLMEPLLPKGSGKK